MGVLAGALRQTPLPLYAVNMRPVTNGKEIHDIQPGGWVSTGFPTVSPVSNWLSACRNISSPI